MKAYLNLSNMISVGREIVRIESWNDIVVNMSTACYDLLKEDVKTRKLLLNNIEEIPEETPTPIKIYDSTFLGLEMKYNASFEVDKQKLGLEVITLRNRIDGTEIRLVDEEINIFYEFVKQVKAQSLL